MTAEVAVMNKSAIALAADSAVTSPYKIYNSVNKLFRLSDHHPVGIMIYGNAEIMGIPWESIIKVYRQKLGTHHESHLQAYADSFIEYLNSYVGFPDIEREMYTRRTILYHLQNLQEIIGDVNIIKTEDRDRKVSETVEAYTRTLVGKCEEFTNIPTDFREQIEKTYGSNISVFINQAFKEYSISTATVDAIKKFCVECLSRNYYKDASGVVVAGFGEDDMFPSLVEYEIEGVAVGNHLKYHTKQSEKVDFTQRAVVMAFAQQEMVELFMTGIHPHVKQHSKSYLKTLLADDEKKILASINSKDEKKELAPKLKEASKIILQEYDSAVQKHQTDDHINPVLGTVAVLPKDELAAMAESLINLTVLKRRISTDRETVGGPIDVVVISKGDGFIWIKRKHYFTKDLNPRYITQHFPIAQLTKSTELP